MKSFAVFANIIQLLTILYLFFVEGMSMGLIVIFALFVFMIVPFINFLVLIFGEEQARFTPFGKKLPKGRKKIIKRKAFRVVYPRERKAVLRINERPYEVVDVSEGGIRFLVGQQEIAKRRVSGQLALLQGEVIEIKGQIEKRQGRQVALLLKDLIPYFTLSQEKAYIDRMIQSIPKPTQ